MTPTSFRPVRGTRQEDQSLPFAVLPLDLRGRMVTLGPTLDVILEAHQYPEPVSRILGESVILALLLGGTLKIEGRFQLQIQTHGPLHFIVVDFEKPDAVRAYARYDEDAVRHLLETDATPSSQNLLGEGYMALTFDPRSEDLPRYQGVIALEGQKLEQAARDYFAQSEQIPTALRIAVAEQITDQGTFWRAGGLFIQLLPQQSEKEDIFEEMEAEEKAQDHWCEAAALMETVEDHELVDPTVSSEQLLYQLFHESGITVYESENIQAKCHCSHDRVKSLVKELAAGDFSDLLDDEGLVSVTCEFCSKTRRFDPAELT